jgi:hypothetical protein
LINIKKITFLFILTGAIFLVLPDLYAQSKAPSKLKTEKGGELRRKYSEKERKNSNKGTVKSKSNLLEKSYYKKKSNETKYPGNVWIDPKPKDFTAIKERVEKNPSRKSLKSEKNRKSFYRASSSMQHKSFGSELVLRRNQNLNYKYSSRSITRSKGDDKIKPLSANYRKSSRKVQKHTGSIFLQPESKKRDYNEIKARVERNPGRSMARQMNQQKNRAISNTTLTQNYKGDVQLKAIKSRQQTYSYGSKTIQKSTGSLRAQRVKSSQNMRKFNSSLNANYKGSIVLPSRNSKRLKYEYMSRVSQKSSGDIKRGAKTPGPQYTSNYSGDVKSNDKKGIKQWRKYESKRQSAFSGDLNARKVNQKSQANPTVTQHVGGLKIYSMKQKQRSNEYSSKVISNYPGNIKAGSAQNQKRMMTGNANRVGNFSGNIKTLSAKHKKQAVEGKALMVNEYEGDIRVLSKRKQDRFMNRDSKITMKYAGSMRGLTPDQRKQALEGKSLTLADYRGEVKTRIKSEKDKKQPRMNALMGEFQGDIIFSARDRKKLEYEYLSKVQHNYQGEVNQKKYTSWLDNRKAKSAALASYQGDIKTSQGDLKEKQFEHMSKTAHNYTGNLTIDRQYARNRYYRNISDRNQQITGDFRVKTRLARDIDEQILSARVQNYQGGPKTSLFNRIWLSLFDNSGKLEKIDDKTRKPKYDSREYKIWY